MSYIKPGKEAWHTCADGSKRRIHQNIVWSVLADALYMMAKRQLLVLVVVT